MRTYAGRGANKAPKTATCTVAEVDKAAWAVLSRVECTDFAADAASEHPLRGWWIATAAGLFRRAGAGALEDPRQGKPPSLSQEHIVIKASPAPMKVGGYMTDSSTDAFEIKAAGAGWCRSRDTQEGNGMDWASVCLEAGKGFVTARSGYKHLEIPGNNVELEVTAQLEKPSASARRRTGVSRNRRVRWPRVR